MSLPGVRGAETRMVASRSTARRRTQRQAPSRLRAGTLAVEWSPRGMLDSTQWWSVGDGGGTPLQIPRWLHSVVTYPGLPKHEGQLASDRNSLLDECHVDPSALHLFLPVWL